MRITHTVNEVKRLVRATKDAFDKLVEGKSGDTYALGFNLILKTDAISSSEIKSLLGAIERSVSSFPNQGPIQVSLDINHQNGFDGNLLAEVQSGYDASKKIEEAAEGAVQAIKTA